jgi:hypothetical protein
MARCFHAFVDHPKILPLLEHFMGEGIILGSLSSRIVRPGDPVQGLHSDVGDNMIGKDSRGRYSHFQFPYPPACFVWRITKPNEKYRGA